jgi:hypothetical protein
MARTAEGRALTQRHQLAQLQLRSVALRDFLRLWPLWTGDEASFRRLVHATIPLVQLYRPASAALAAAYFDSFRQAEAKRGVIASQLAGDADLDQLVASLYVTGQVMTGKALEAGQSPQAAMQTSLTRVSGAVGRHILAGGRQTLLESTRADRAARGWGRIVSAGACDFCQQFEGDIVSPDTDFSAHDHCSCSVEPAY